MENSLFLLSSMENGKPVLLELLKNLEDRGIPAYNIDIFACKKRDCNGNVEDIFTNVFLKILFNRIPKIRLIVRYLGGRYFIKHYVHNGDVIVFQSIIPTYYLLISLMESRTDKIITHWWGSDLYRSTDKTKKILGKILDKCYRVVLFKGMTSYFVNYFPSHTAKIKYARFGTELIDIIREKRLSFRSNDIRKKYFIPEDKIIITCAYNSHIGQQHILIIEAIEKLPLIVKDKIFLLFPMTYGGDDNYRQSVINRLLESKLPHFIMRSYLTNDDLSEVRLLSDIVVNIQVTDGFSVSIQESLFSGSVLIIGDWLNYPEYKEWGIFYLKVTLENMHQVIEEVLTNLDYYKDLSKPNTEIIYKNSSWSAVIDNIIDVYDCRHMVSRLNEPLS